MVCFGAKASTTDRGKSVKGLIKEGKEYFLKFYRLTQRYAIVRIRISNRGQDAFRFDEFGESITIERRFKQNGTNSYKILSETGMFLFYTMLYQGQLVSHKKEDLTAICEHMQILVENPLTILTQDTSRMFLANSSSADKYKVFFSQHF